ncbi:MAG: choice-of-anchor B family protein, partial [Actinomycetota bacterium]|nr:choice-of-anchor B family protein [Actinomycetota bacterium]
MKIVGLPALLVAMLLAVPSTASGQRVGFAPEDPDAPLVQPAPTPTPSIDATPLPQEVETELDRKVEVAPSRTADAEPTTRSPAPGVSIAPASNAAQRVECQEGMAGPFPCKNVDLESMVPLGGAGAGSGNDVWGWTDPKTGREYALVGSALETTFIDVTDPQDPRTVGSLPTAEDAPPDFVLWRDIKVDGNWAFIVSEITGHGMQVFDLRRLRDPASVPQIFTADAVYRGADDEDLELGNAHNIAINEKTDVAYVVGSNTCVSSGPGGQNGGLHMVDISDPKNPKFLNCARVTDPPEHNYVHDVQCVVYRGPDQDYQGREICFGSNEQVVTIYDVTDKSNPVVISQWHYPQAAYTHQGWLSPNHRFFLFGDESDEQAGTVDNTTTYIMDALDLDEPREPKAFAHDTTAIDHNLYIDNDLVYEANYGAGLRILDFNNTSLGNGQLNEVGFFDIRPGPDPPEFVGAWSNYPFFESGIVVMSAIEEG